MSKLVCFSARHGSAGVQYTKNKIGVRQGCTPLLHKPFTATLVSSVGQLNWNINKSAEIGGGSTNNLHVVHKNETFCLYCLYRL